MTEAYDRLRPWRAAQRHAEAARRRVEGIRPRCAAGGVTAPADAVPALSLPGAGEVFFGRVAGPAPARVDQGADQRQRGKSRRLHRSGGGRFSVRATVRSGPALVEALFLNAAGEQVGAAVSRDAFALPRAATKATREAATRPRALGPARSGGPCLQRLFVGSPREARDGDRRGVATAPLGSPQPRPSSSP